MSLSFLGKKSFHPSAPQNVAKLFMAEEKLKAEAKKVEELKRMHEAESTARETRNMFDGNSSKAESVPLSTSFMYQLPPGMAEAQAKRKAEAIAEKTKAEQDVERFGELVKNAPRTGVHTADLDVTHRPFGVTLRKTKCSKCGEWGHSHGDRECPMRNTVSGLDDAQKEKDDPMAGRVQQAGGEASGEALRWAPKRAPDAGAIGGSAASGTDANQQYVAGLDDDEMEAAAEVAVAAQLMAKAQADEAAALAEIDPTVLSMLNDKQKRQLLKMYRKKLGGAEPDGDAAGKKRKKHKSSRKEKKSGSKRSKSRKSSKHQKAEKERKRRGSGSGSGSSTSDSD